MNLKRIRIGDIQRANLLSPGNNGIIRFDDGTAATVLCMVRGQIVVNYLGNRQTIQVVDHHLRRGSRVYFLVNGRRVLDLYFAEGLGFTSRHAAGLSYASENAAKPFPIPRKGTFDSGRVIG